MSTGAARAQEASFSAGQNVGLGVVALVDPEIVLEAEEERRG